MYKSGILEQNMEQLCVKDDESCDIPINCPICREIVITNVSKIQQIKGFAEFVMNKNKNNDHDSFDDINFDEFVDWLYDRFWSTY